MDIVNRAKNIMLTPATEWPVIAAEPATVGGILGGYAGILALLPLVGVILTPLLGLSAFALLGLGMGYFVALGVVGYVVSLLILFLMSFVVEALAPSFGARKSRVDALKWLAYAVTPLWVASLLLFIPLLGALLVLAALVYAGYILYLGAGPVMGASPSKAGALTAVTIVAWIVVGYVANRIIAGIVLASLVHPGVVPGTI